MPARSVARYPTRAASSAHPLPTQSLVKEGYTFDVAFTSVLKRAIKTLNIVQDEMNLDWIPVHRHWCAPTRPALYR